MNKTEKLYIYLRSYDIVFNLLFLTVFQKKRHLMSHARKADTVRMLTLNVMATCAAVTRTTTQKMMSVCQVSQHGVSRP